MFSIGAFAVMFDEQKKALLCHRNDYDIWNLPGGGVEDGEAPWEGAIREVKEETGLIVDIDRLISIYTKPEKNQVVFYFVCKVVGGKLTTSEEADRVQYFKPTDIPSSTIPKHSDIIQRALTYPGQPELRVQVGPSYVDTLRRQKGESARC